MSLKAVPARRAPVRVAWKAGQPSPVACPLAGEVPELDGIPRQAAASSNAGVRFGPALPGGSTLSDGSPQWGETLGGTCRGTREGVDGSNAGSQHEGLVAEGSGMPTIETLTARMDVISIVLQELARVLSAPQAAAVADQIRQRLVPVSSVLSGDADEAALAEAAPVLLALGQK